MCINVDSGQLLSFTDVVLTCLRFNY